MAARDYAAVREFVCEFGPEGLDEGCLMEPEGCCWWFPADKTSNSNSGGALTASEPAPEQEQEQEQEQGVDRAQAADSSSEDDDVDIPEGYGFGIVPGFVAAPATVQTEPEPELKPQPEPSESGSEGKEAAPGPWLVVADTGNCRVSVFSGAAAGGPVRVEATFGEDGMGLGQFDCPRGVAVTNDGSRLVVADSSNHRVQVLMLPHGDPVCVIGDGQGSREGQFSFPYGVAVTVRDEIVVVDSANARVQVFDAEGFHVRTLGNGYGAGDGQLNFPHAVCYDPVRDQIVVADSGNSRVCIFQAQDGVFVRAFATPRQPASLAVDPAGRLLVACGKLTAYDPDTGTAVATLEALAGGANAVAVARDGTVAAVTEDGFGFDNHHVAVF